MFDAATASAYASAQAPVAKAEAVRDSLGSGTLTVEIRRSGEVQYTGTFSGPLVAGEDGELSKNVLLTAAISAAFTPNAATDILRIRNDSGRYIEGPIGAGGRFTMARPCVVGQPVRLNFSVTPTPADEPPLVSGALVAVEGGDDVLAIAGDVATDDPTEAPLVQSTDLTFLGSFRLPDTGASFEFDYAGTTGGCMGLGVNGASLFVPALHQSNTNDGLGEVSIPGSLGTGSVSGLPTATLLKTPVDPSENQRAIGTSYYRWNLGGSLIEGTRLIFTAWDEYDGGMGTQTKSHYSRPLNLATTGDVDGPLTLSGAPARWIGGYMCRIPPEWQSLFGKPALTGIAGTNNVQSASAGPCCAMFDPATLTSCTLLLGYSHENDLANVMGTDVDTENPYYNYTCLIRGIVFAPGTRSVLFFGSMGLGKQSYEGGGYTASNRQFRVWAYDANDLLAVKNGTKDAGELQPYSIWTLTVPYGPSSEPKSAGCVFDPATNRIYFAECGRDTEGGRSRPVIHVYELDV